MLFKNICTDGGRAPLQCPINALGEVNEEQTFISTSNCGCFRWGICGTIIATFRWASMNGVRKINTVQW